MRYNASSRTVRAGATYDRNRVLLGARHHHADGPTRRGGKNQEIPRKTDISGKYRKNPTNKPSLRSALRPSLMANRFWFLEIEFSAPSQAYLNRETGESGPLFLKSHQSFCERHATPFAVSSGYHFEKLSIHSSFLYEYSVSDEILSGKEAIFSAETSICI